MDAEPQPMSTPVAVDGDTQFETSSATLAADTDGTGAWHLTSSSVTLGATLSVNGKPVEIAATASWTYVGGAAGGTALVPQPTDSATLTAAATRLKDNDDNLLLDGDQATGAVDANNRIVVAASQNVLRTD